LSLADLPPSVVAVLAATFVLGALVQGLVGLGLGLVAAPFVTLLEPSLMPDLMLWLAAFLPMVTLVREHDAVDWPALGWSMAARLPGTVVGAWLVSVLAASSIGAAVGAMVLVSVVLTARSVVVPVNRHSLAVAGFASGITGTATSIGGPPLAILLQHRPPRQIRCTMAVYFLLGASLSLLFLAVAGQVELTSLLLALGYVPCLLTGFALSRPLRRVLPARYVRPLVLALCAASALLLLVRSLL
jgi:uncharacterized membrane protein YfcA